MPTPDQARTRAVEEGGGEDGERDRVGQDGQEGAPSGSPPPRDRAEKRAREDGQGAHRERGEQEPEGARERFRPDGQEIATQGQGRRREESPRRDREPGRAGGAEAGTGIAIGGFVHAAARPAEGGPEDSSWAR
ncbi:MAG: hypothetical protein R3F20_14870 [Planctomycetota bacterium]